MRSARRADAEQVGGVAFSEILDEPWALSVLAGLLARTVKFELLCRRASSEAFFVRPWCCWLLLPLTLEFRVCPELCWRPAPAMRGVTAFVFVPEVELPLGPSAPLWFRLFCAAVEDCLGA